MNAKSQLQPELKGKEVEPKDESLGAAEVEMAAAQPEEDWG